MRGSFEFVKIKMKRIMLTVAYDGTAYSGWQLQEGVPTIEGELNKAILKLTGETVEVAGASRTDAGVHALCNLAIFDTDSTIPGEKFSYALNPHLPEDIRVVASKEVAPDFHPRKTATRKTYEYRILNRDLPDPTRRLYTYFAYGPIDVTKMQEAAKYLEGEHDFASFCSPATQALTTVRTIYLVDVKKAEDEIVIRVTGNGFLYNMVRIIAGTLLEAGRGRLAPEEIPVILDKKNRQAAGPTAPACGLMLVDYEFVSEEMDV